MYNAGNAFTNGVGKFQPTIPGYYQLNLEAVRLAGGFVSATIRMNGTTNGQVQYNETSGGNFPSVTCSEVFYFNGTTDYAQAQVNTAGTTNALLTFSGVQASVAPPASTPPVTTATAFTVGDTVNTTNAEWCVTTLDNLSVKYRCVLANASFSVVISALSGTVNLYGTLTQGAAGTTPTIRALTGLVAGTGGFVIPYAINNAGSWQFTVWDQVSNHYYNITCNFTQNVRCNILIERVF